MLSLVGKVRFFVSMIAISQRSILLKSGYYLLVINFQNGWEDISLRNLPRNEVVRTVRLKTHLMFGLH